MSEQRFKLEKYKSPQSRYRCPGCGHAREFTRYIETATGQQVAEQVGRCNRVDRCGYHLTPKQYFEQNGIAPAAAPVPVAPEAQPVKELFTIPLSQMEATLCNYPSNTFATCLSDHLGEAAAVDLLLRWQCIGTSSRYPGAVIFWQIDRHGIVRTGKVMKYRPDFHREGFTTWAHAGLVPDHLEMRQCFFGEHLLALLPKKMPVAICESEKTALIASHFLPDFIWMAAGNLQGLSERKMQALGGRRVVLYPDLGAGFTTWQKKAKELSHITDIHVSDYLERVATEDQRAAGLDLADYLLSLHTKKSAA